MGEGVGVVRGGGQGNINKFVKLQQQVHDQDCKCATIQEIIK
jgi:hypothetical protein